MGQQQTEPSFQRNAVPWEFVVGWEPRCRCMIMASGWEGVNGRVYIYLRAKGYVDYGNETEQRHDPSTHAILPGQWTAQMEKVALIVCIWFQVLQYFKKTRNICDGMGLREA